MTIFHADNIPTIALVFIVGLEWATAKPKAIGTLLIMLLWIYVNAFGLIIGFELNASISRWYPKELV